MSSLSSYLAKNYLTASNASDHSDRPKKRRKKDKSAALESSLIIADDDDLLLSGKQNVRAEDEDGIPAMYEGQHRSAEFRKKKTSGWKSVSQPGDGTGDAGGDEEADRILASAAADQEQRRQDIAMDDAPAIVSDHDEDGSAPKMESGVKAGLQTAEDTKRLLEKEERQRRREEKEARKLRKTEPEEETIYRDATGRRIDVSLRRAEIRKQQEAEEQAKRREKEDAMGDVQRRQKEERKQDLEDAKFLSLGRGEDDEEMNEKLKEEIRFDDPMREYMAQKRAEESGSRGGGELEARTSGKGAVGGVAKTTAKVYQGHAPPNRYGILPGWRWDGVDRGMGSRRSGFRRGVGVRGMKS